jgi:glycosyltransferase involved in cell wall biosynthesis
MNKKTVLVHVTSSLKMGGAEMVLYTLIQQLQAEHVEHHVMYFHDGPVRKHLEALNIPLYQIQGIVGRYDPIFWWRLLKTVRLLKPTKIHALLWMANCASRIIGKIVSIPVVCVYHNNIDQDGWLRNIIDRLTIFRTTTLVAVSDEVAHSITHHIPSVAYDAIAVIKNGIDIDHVHKKSRESAVSRASLGLLPEHIIIGSVGRFSPVKNYEFLLRTFAPLSKKYSHMRLLLVGCGPQEGYLRTLTQQLAITRQVIFVVGQQAYGYYPLFDVFTQTSDKEGISIALLEAMSMGIVCIVTQRDARHAVITSGKQGIVVASGNRALFVQSLEEILHNNALKKVLTQGALNLLRDNFEQKVMVAHYRKLLL